MTKTAKFFIALFAILIGIYPFMYFFIDRTFGLLATKPIDLLSNLFWNVAFYGHIVPGGIALGIGWIQFNHKLRVKRPLIHKNIGKLYIIAVIISGICGIYIGCFATGGWISSLGFILLGVIWLITTALALAAIKKSKVKAHQKWMIFSYAACFSAVTLRIWLPTLSVLLGEFIVAYRISAWLCWVPNLVVAYFLTKKL